MDFSSTLLREKFVISDSRGEAAEGHPMIVTSNRMVVPLLDIHGQPAETFVVRAQTMHACIRMASRIIQTYQRTGPLMARDEKFDFLDAWDNLIEDHERKFNPERWVAVYNNGRLIFSAEDHPMFLDMVEKCDSRNSGHYEEAIKMAERSLIDLGKTVTITHEGHIGLVATIQGSSGKCGLILRNPNRRTTFNIMAANKGDRSVTAVQTLTVSAAFLEGVQIAFQIGMTNEKVRLGLAQRHSDEDKRAESGRRRLGRLMAEIRTYENSLDVRYRPEKPDFSQVVSDAEAFAHDILKHRLEQQDA